MLDQLFTHVDDLRKMEPEYFRRGSSEVSEAQPVAVSALGKTPISILEEFSKKTSKEVAYSLMNETLDENNVSSFGMQCVVRPHTTVGQGKTKRAAKHEAAAAMIRKLVCASLGYAKDMGIPYSSEDLALKFLDSMESETSSSEVVPPADDCKPFSASENYVGKVQEIAQRVKLHSAIYESTEEGPANDRTYVTTCKINEHATEGKAKQKKVSKAIAAYHMVCHLEKNLAAIIGVDEAGNDFASEDSTAAGNATACTSVKRESVEALKDFLASSLHLSASTVEYEECSGNDRVSSRIMLKLKLVEAEKDPKFLNYPGRGGSTEDASNDAARLALLHLQNI